MQWQNKFRLSSILLKILLKRRKFSESSVSPTTSSLLLSIYNVLSLKTLPLYNIFQAILQIIRHVCKSSIFIISIFCLPKSTAESRAQWAAAQPLGEPSHFPADEAGKVETELHCPVFWDRGFFEQPLWHT